MAWTRMSEREVRRVEVLNEVQSGRRTVLPCWASANARRIGCWLKVKRTAGSGWYTKPEAARRTGAVTQASRSSPSSWSRPTVPPISVPRWPTELFDDWDKPLEVRWRSQVLPYRVFSKTSVSVHSHRRAQAPGSRLCYREGTAGFRLATKVMTNSEKTGYAKRGKTEPMQVPKYQPTVGSSFEVQ